MENNKALISISKLDIKTAKDKEAYEIPEEGSLGLLALGYVGLMAWREKRKQMAKARKKVTT